MTDLHGRTQREAGRSRIRTVIMVVQKPIRD